MKNFRKAIFIKLKIVMTTPRNMWIMIPMSQVRWRPILRRQTAPQLRPLKLLQMKARQVLEGSIVPVQSSG